MEIYEFSLKIPLPDEPFKKGRALVSIAALLDRFVSALSLAKFDGVQLHHGMKTRRGDYGKRKPRQIKSLLDCGTSTGAIVPPEPISTAPMPFCRVLTDEDARVPQNTWSNAFVEPPA